MTTTVDSTLDIGLPQTPDIGDGSTDDIYDALLTIHNSIEILHGDTTAAATQGAITNSTGGAQDGTLVAIAGSGDDANINNNFTDLHALLDEIRTALVARGIIKGSA